MNDDLELTSEARMGEELTNDSPELFCDLIAVVALRNFDVYLPDPTIAAVDIDGRAWDVCPSRSAAVGAAESQTCLGFFSLQLFRLFQSGE